ncbi:hypothetical protein Tco_0932823 [Tanacetum coccineum]
MDRSFTLGSTEEADNVKILQSCNDCSLDNSPYFSSAGLRIAFNPTKSPHYKLVDAGHTFCDIDIQIYSSETGDRASAVTVLTTSVLIILIVPRTDEFMTPFPEVWSIQSNVWSVILGEREQDSFLLIKLYGKVVQYNLISKTLHEIYDCGSNQVDDNRDDNDDADDVMSSFSNFRLNIMFMSSYHLLQVCD